MAPTSGGCFVLAPAAPAALRPTLPHLRPWAAYPPPVASTAIGATWPHRSGGIGVNDILLPVIGSLGPQRVLDRLCLDK